MTKLRLNSTITWKMALSSVNHNNYFYFVQFLNQATSISNLL